MPLPSSITAYSIIAGNRMIKNGVTLFEDTPGNNAADFLLNCYRHLGMSYPKFYKMDNLCKLGLLAAEILLKDGGITDSNPYHTGIVLSNANASLDADTRYYGTIANIPSPALFVYTLPNIVIGEISIKFSLKGENAFFIFDSFDAGFTATYVNNLFDSTVIQRCICGWVDILDNDYKAVLFFAEKDSTGAISAFTEENLNNIYRTSDGKS